MFNLESLPPLSERIVVQTWRLTMPPVNGTRSLEYVGDRAFIVARTTDNEGQPFGGTEGQEVVRHGPSEWHGLTTGIIWSVGPDGGLEGSKDSELVFAGVPCATLWG
ncbi:MULTISPECIES: hypothetical protein [unclassified Rhizobacter]|uniref:hypothetical protein n=1 Tax=unclassified Rhizobacter TaxID=2640088 RepID=UPI0012FB0CD4|nr:MULTISPECIES: hypothetical protein [unclassified Rhizobacter]